MKKFFSFPLLFLLFSVAAFSQTIPNSDFESVTYDSAAAKYLADGWYSDPYGSAATPTFVSSGTYSLAVWNWYTYAKGYAKNGNLSGFVSMYDWVAGGTPITGKPSKLSGMYIYDTSATYSNHDSAWVVIVLKKWNVGLNKADTVAFTNAFLTASASPTNMQPFEIDIIDLMPGINPDSIVVTFVSSVGGYCDASICLYLYLDDLSLTVTGIDGAEEKIPFSMYPNPAQQDLFINIGETEADEALVYDISGKLRTRFGISPGERELRVPASVLEQGNYIVQLQTKGSISGSRILQIRR